ncbi:MAG TPA: outer membrane beta-barrel protein [Polyangiaceae bacterium]|nr:outer membrane beta-barrel protein [Polyangiaceae bacterium]
MRFAPHKQPKFVLVAAVVALGSEHAALAEETPPLASIVPFPASNDDARLRELERQNRLLREDLERLKADHDFTKTRVEQVMPLTNRISGYLDLGFFYVQGNGSGVRRDAGNVRFPEYASAGQWVFGGDPLSTAVNARGEPASTGESRAILWNPIKAGGSPTFIANALNVGLFTGVGDDLTVNGMFDLVPRGRDVSDGAGLFLGDFLDVKLAYVDYSPVPGVFSISAGKFDSVIGREYRTKESPDRLTVTPSLICRYTCGHPIGVKARLRLFDETLVLHTAITNGSNGVETFTLYNEVDTNGQPTASSRLSYRFPGAAHFEMGASGAYGAQDVQTNPAVKQWHYGFDAHLDWKGLDFTAEVVKGHAPGASVPGESPCSVAQCLRYQGAYGQLGYRVNNWFIPFVRWDYRDALHQHGASFVYVSQLMRATGGVRLELGTNVILKAEYTLNRELGRVPEFKNDIFTSALVVKF